jgi:hypothetical protein
MLCPTPELPSHLAAQVRIVDVNKRRVWSSWLVMSLAWPAVAAPAAEAAVQAEAASAVRRGNVLSLRKTIPVVPDHRAEIHPFVRWATAGDLAAVVNAFDDVPLRANGAAAIEQFAANEVIPFFLDAARLDDAMRVTRATFEDGTEGHMAYAYVVTTRGEARPFVIAWRESERALRVMDLQLGRCVKHRHPVAAGRCDR